MVGTSSKSSFKKFDDSVVPGRANGLAHVAKALAVCGDAPNEASSMGVPDFRSLPAGYTASVD